MTASGTEEPLFVEYRPNRRRRLGIVAVLGVLLLVLGVVYSVRLTVYSPESVVQAYFRALADRDPGAALRVMDPRPESDLLVPEVLESPAYLPPEDLAVLEVSTDGDEAQVELSFTINGGGHTVTMRLTRGDGTLDRLFQRWRITDGVRPLSLGETPGEITVNGVPVVAHDLAGPRTLPALFGGYELGLPADDPLWDSSRAVIVLVGRESGVVDVPMVARPEVRAEVERQLTEILDECAASTELLPPGCPFGNARIAEAEDVAWRISAYPRLGLDSGPDGFGGVTMLVNSTEDGEAVVTGTREAFGAPRPFETVVAFPVSGTVTADGAAIRFQPSW